MGDLAWALAASVLFMSVATCSYFETLERGKTERSYIEHGYCRNAQSWIHQWEKCKP